MGEHRTVYEDESLTILDKGDKVYFNNEGSRRPRLIMGNGKEINIEGEEEFDWENILESNSYVYDKDKEENLIFLKSKQNTLDLQIKLNQKQVNNIDYIELNSKMLGEERFDIRESRLIIKNIGLNLPNSVTLNFESNLPNIRLDDVFKEEDENVIDISGVKEKVFSFSIEKEEISGEIAFDNNVYILNDNLRNSDIYINEFTNSFINSYYTEIKDEINNYNNLKFKVTILPDDYVPVEKEVKSGDNIVFTKDEFKELSEIEVNSNEDKIHECKIKYNDKNSIQIGRDYLSEKYSKKHIESETKIRFSKVLPNRMLLVAVPNHEYEENGQLLQPLNFSETKKINIDFNKEEDVW